MAGSPVVLRGGGHGGLGQGGAPGAEPRFQESYDERRRYFALRALVDDFVEAARGLNRVAVRAGVDGAYGLGTTRELDRLQRQMQFLVAGMRQVAGKEGRAIP